MNEPYLYEAIFPAVDFPLKPLAPAPVFSTEPGPYELAVAGKGTLASGGNATLTLNLGGPPVGAWLYLSGKDDPAGPAPHFPAGDATVRVAITNGNGVTRVLGTVPVAYDAGIHFVNRVEITRFLSRGTNTLAISGYDLNFPEGAFAYAVYDGGADTPAKLVQALDGLDFAYYLSNPPYGPDSELASFVFDPSAAERRGRVVLVVAGAEPGRGDEVVGFVGTGLPAEKLPDTDRDGLPDILNRLVPLVNVDGPPLGIEPAGPGGTLEAHKQAFSLEEDALGVPRAQGGLGVGPELNILSKRYDIGVGRTHANFQVQSEDPEFGDSLTLIVALNEITLEGTNPIPEIEVIKDVTPAEMPETSGPATFTVTVNNLGAERVRLESLVDDVFGDLDGVGTCELPRVLAIGGSYSCTFDAVVNGTVETPHHDTVEAKGVGLISGEPTGDTDDATVTFTRPATASLGDRVWLDVDRDGVQDAGETGINGLTVRLEDAGGNTLATTTTATSGGVVGYYLFTDLAAGAYRVEVVVSENMVQTYDLDGVGTPNEAARALAAGEAATDVDFGYFIPAPDFTLEKTASRDEGYPGELVTYTFTVRNTGNVRLEGVEVHDDTLGFGLIGTVTLEIGGSATLEKTGYALPVCAEGGLTVPTLCADTTGSFAVCSLPNTARATWGALTRTASDCVNILPYGSIGDRVWLDLNRDGVQDAGEPGINGLPLVLKDALTGEVLATTTTAINGDVDGWYLFADLPARLYRVEVETPADHVQTYSLGGLLGAALRAILVGEHARDVDYGFAPRIRDFELAKTASIDEGYPGELVTYVFTVRNTGEAALTDVDVTDDKLGHIGTIALLEVGESKELRKTGYVLPVCDAAGFTSKTLCEGSGGSLAVCSLPNTATATWRTTSRTAKDCVNILPFGSIGDYVWEDKDKDGLQDAGEPPIAGVTLTLSKGGVVVGTATTGANGGYLFADLKAGTYAVDSGGKVGYSLTTANDPMDVALGIGENYLLADFGYWKPAPAIHLEKTAEPTDVLAGAQVTYTFVVTNTGDAVLVEIDVTDDKLGYIGTIPELAVGASATLTKTVAAPACGTGGTTDEPCAFAVGPACDPQPEYCYLHNVATARGYEKVFRTVVTDDDDACIRIRKPVPRIAVTKAADPTFGYLFAADPATAWPYQLVSTPLVVDYTVEVTNPGEEPLLNVTVTDDPAALVFTYQSGDANGDGALDLTETWVYTARWTYTVAGTYPDEVTARGTGVHSGKLVEALDDATVKAVACGQCLGKVKRLTLRYDGAAPATIKVVAENDKFTNPVAFNALVQPGGTFSFGPLSSWLASFNGTLGTNVDVYVNGVYNTSIHTSCSQPIYPGMVVPPVGGAGGFTVLSGASKQGGSLCPLVTE